jgi:pyridoxal phosphate enzyme (YggS family)
MIDATAVALNIAHVRTRITAAGGRDVTLVCVTKGFGPEAIAAVRTAGETVVGESYGQELVAKRDALFGLEVHFIGRLQTNKVRIVAPLVQCVQSVDRASLVDELARRAPGMAVMIQVNLAGEAQKGGCRFDEAPILVDRARRAGLTVVGLMGVGPLGPPEEARAGFVELRATVERLGLRHCSMGMSDDLEVAVASGSTMVRVGSALFGPRPPARGHGG